LHVFGETFAKPGTEGTNPLNVAWTLKNYNVLANLHKSNESAAKQHLRKKEKRLTAMPSKQTEPASSGFSGQLAGQIQRCRPNFS